MKNRMFLIIAIISVAVMTIDDNAFGQYLTSGTLNGHEWVDLGLPSGTKWATCNVGASTPRRFGGYYILKEVVGDAGYGHWEGWQVPTVDQIRELKNNCEWSEESGGYKVTGPNGNSIYLPAAGKYCKYSRDEDYIDETTDRKRGYYYANNGSYLDFTFRSYDISRNLNIYDYVKGGCNDCNKYSLRLVVESY